MQAVTVGTRVIHNDAAIVDELIAILQSGSPVVDARLASIYATADNELADRLIDGVAVEAAAGSPYALHLLLNLIANHRLAHPAISRYLSAPAAQEDAHQEVLIAVARSIHRYRGESKFTTWLYTIARNTAVAEFRKAKPAVPLDDDGSHGDTLRFTSRAADRQVLQVAISQLPAIFRDIVYLRDIERMSYDDIAVREGIALNTVRSRLSRGRALLANQLSSFDEL